MTQLTQNQIQATANQILAVLPSLSDSELRVLKGRLTLNAYGVEVGELVADAVVSESRNRRARAN